MVIFWQGLLWERQFEKNPIETWLGEKFQIENVFLHRGKGLFLSVYVDDIKLAGKKTKTLIRCGKYSTKNSIWKNQHLSWIMCTWDALKDNAK